MKLLIVLEIDVKPNEIEVGKLPKELSDNILELKDYFSNDEVHIVKGLKWTGEKVLSVSKKM